MAKTKKAPTPKVPAVAMPQPRADINGWVLCPGDSVIIVSPGEQYHGLFAKVDAFPTTLELSSYVQIDGRPSKSGRVLLPNAQLRWMGPDPDRLDMHRPTRPGERVRVVLSENGVPATPGYLQLKSIEGKLGTVTELIPTVEGRSMVTVKLDDPAELPTAINSYDLLVVPIPVVQYVPEPEAAPVAAEEIAITMPAWDLLFIAESKGGLSLEDVATAGAEVQELSSKGLIEYMPGEGMNYRITAAGRDLVADDQPALPVATEQPAEFRNIWLQEIHVTRNTRKVFDETALAELAESIKAHGVLQPIVVRPYTVSPFTGVHFELVAGERRYRAAQLAGLQDIPAMVRVLDDRAFIEVQLLENLQRQDVRPSDEAQAFAELLNKHKFSAEEIALKVGKPVKFVLQRAKLVTLIPFWMELLQSDRLPLVAAHELARIPAHSQVVVKKAFENSWEMQQSGQLSARSIHETISREVLNQLSSAAFPKDDTTLCPGVGSCINCPKNSANHLGLFDDVATDPVAAKCLDAACFSDKKAAFLERRLKVATETGAPIISSSYSNPPAGALGYKFYDRAKEGTEGAVLALMVDGHDAGNMIWVKLSNSAPNPETVAQDRKAERAASMRATRLKRVTNELLAGDLRDLFARELPTNGPGACALLDSFIDKALTWGYSKIPNDTLTYLVAHHGWEQPTEQDLNNAYVSSTVLSGHRQYILRQLAAMPSLLDKVVLYFDLKKFRDGLEQKEPGAIQNSMLQVLPKAYQKELNVTKRAEQLVEERYYSKKGAKK